MRDLASRSSVLIADDDEELLDLMSYGLRHQGFDIVGVRDGEGALARMRERPPALVLLDVSLPRMNGLDVCRAIRQESDTPVIVVSARGDEDSIVRGFLAGADDYVVKPFSYRQLSLRIQAVLRRASVPLPRRGRVRAGAISLDPETREARVDGQAPVRLTKTEFRILELLAANVDRPVPATRIVESAWGFDDGGTELLKSHVYHIRRKLRLPSKGPGGIEAVSQLGYVLRAMTR